MRKRSIFILMGLFVFSFCTSLTNNNKVSGSSNIYYRDITDIIGSRTPIGRDDDLGEPIEVPDVKDLTANYQFKKYDPHYPKINQYGNPDDKVHYTLRVPSLKDRLTFSRSSKNKLVGSLYAPGVTSSTGTRDATKRWGKDYGNADGALCFAASSSNLISWYLDRYKMLNPHDSNYYESDPEKIFDKFRMGWDPASGGDAKEALSWYFTGGFPSGSKTPNSGQPINPNERGGYLKNKIPHNTSERWIEVSLDWNHDEFFSVFGGYKFNPYFPNQPYDDGFPYLEETYVGAFKTYESFSEYIVRQLHYGPTAFSVLKDTGNLGHSITLWGADYEVESGLVTKLHFTDSDDSRGRFSVDVGRDDNNQGVKLLNYYYTSPLGQSERYSRARDSLMLYAPDVVVKSQPIKTITSDQSNINIINGEGRIKLKAITDTGTILDYIPESNIVVKDVSGTIISPERLETFIDEATNELVVKILDNNLKNGNYTFSLEDIASKNVYSLNLNIGSSEIEETSSYTITFNPNGGQGNELIQNLKKGSKETLIKNSYTKLGYKFDGWSKTITGEVVFRDEELVENLVLENGGNLNLYAVWTPITYTIKYKPNGGSGNIPNQTISYDSTVRLSKNTFTKTGYAFKGWSTSSTGEVVYSENESINNLGNIDGAIIDLYAVWTPITYTIKYKPNGGTGNIPNQTISYDSTVRLSKNTFTKTGYIFKGWSTSSTGEVVYSENESINYLGNIDGAIIDLYAVWTPITYTIKYKPNGGSGNIPNQVLDYDMKTKLTKNAFVKDGYKFIGWSDSTTGNPLYKDEDNVINLSTIDGEVITLNAVWEKVEEIPEKPNDEDDNKPLVPIEADIEPSNNSSEITNTNSTVFIVIGSVLGVGLIAFVVWIVFRKKR